MTGTWRARVNGRPAERPDLPDDERLLDTLRDGLGLLGTKPGCRSGNCGACTVLVDGEATLSCLLLAREAEGTTIETVEGLADDRVGRAVQAAFVAEDGLQCGYCTPGFVVALTGLLRAHGGRATPERLLADLDGHLCRCTGYGAIVRAVRAAREAVR